MIRLTCHLNWECYSVDTHNTGVINIGQDLLRKWLHTHFQIVHEGWLQHYTTLQRLLRRGVVRSAYEVNERFPASREKKLFTYDSYTTVFMDKSCSWGKSIRLLDAGGTRTEPNGLASKSWGEGNLNSHHHSRRVFSMSSRFMHFNGIPGDNGCSLYWLG